MKFSGKMCFKIILKVTKNEGFALSLEDTIFEKPQGGGQIDPPPPSHFRVKLRISPPENFLLELIFPRVENFSLELKIFSFKLRIFS